MRSAPSVFQVIKTGGTLNWSRVVQLAGGHQGLLVDDHRLRLFSPEGKLLWSRLSAGTVCFQGALRQHGGHDLLMASGPRLSLLDASTGKTLWQHRFQPDFVSLRIQVADILPELPGMEAAVFLNHGEKGCVINFPPSGEPRFIWEKKVVHPGKFNERYDHHCHIRLDLSQPGLPVIWNVRRYRCRGFDARTGEMLSSLEYDIGGQPRRNYGPFDLGRGKKGALYACVFGEQVQIHVHAIRLHRKGSNELAWQHYYGEVYKKTPGVALVSHGVVDYDGDGDDEMIYSVRDPARGFRTFVRVRNIETGRVEFELADHWGAGLFQGVGPDHAAGLLAWEAPAGATPSRGRLGIYLFNRTSTPRRLATLEQAGLWGPMTVAAAAGHELLLHRYPEGGRQNRLERYHIAGRKLVRTAQTAAESLLAAPIQQVLRMDPIQEDAQQDAIGPAASERVAYVISSPQGRLEAATWDGSVLWQHDLQGGAAARLSAGDLNGDGRAELVASTASRRLRVFTFDPHGSPRESFSDEYLAGWREHSPVLYDLEGNGRLCLLASGSDPQGNFCIRAYRGDRSLLWETPLGVTAQSVSGCIMTAGRFLSAEHAGVAVSLKDSRRIHEGTTMLDARNGKKLWHKTLYHNGQVTMPYWANGTPTAYDFDHDGTEELGMDLLSYMAYLKGPTGAFAFVLPTNNLRAEGAAYAGRLYNTYCPIYKQPADDRPHWFPIVGFGPIGLMKPDPREGVWKIDLDYDVPPNVALVDVDGDGSLEAGYAALNAPTFYCRDVWTGRLEWKLTLPTAPNSPTITADVDSDGKGEFLCGRYCIGTDSAGRGQLRWQSPVPLGWPIIADFDGDGQGEIATAQPGRIVILQGKQP